MDIVRYLPHCSMEYGEHLITRGLILEMFELHYHSFTSNNFESCSLGKETFELE